MEFIILFVILGIIAIIYDQYTSTPGYKGKKFEKEIHKILTKIAINRGGLEFHDLMFEFGNSTAQIDNVLLTDKAIYVIEAKNYSGYIFGSIQQDYWTTTLKSTKNYKTKSGRTYSKSYVNKYQFYNPYKQNETHVKAIKQLLKTDLPIYNIVVFSNRATLQKINAQPDHNIIQLKDLRKLIEEKENEILNPISLNLMIEIIEDFYFENIIEKKARKNHVKDIKRKYS